MKHTEGKWFAYADTILTNKGKIGEVCTQNDLCKDNWQANAKLIAAAPDMLKVLQQFIHSVEHEGVIEGRVVDAVRNAEEAIKKATE